jgi:hypothetical protein
MHRSRARDVHITQLVQEAVGSPRPSRRYTVYYCVQEREQTVRLEVAPVGNPTNLALCSVVQLLFQHR